jgi:hypothetical protein
MWAIFEIKVLRKTYRPKKRKEKKRTEQDWKPTYLKKNIRSSTLRPILLG